MDYRILLTAYNNKRKSMSRIFDHISDIHQAIMTMIITMPQLQQSNFHSNKLKAFFAVAPLKDPSLRLNVVVEA